MRWLLLVGLYACASQPGPAPAPPARAKTPREILDALPPPPQRAPLRGMPDVAPLLGPALAWRPFWPVDRIGSAVTPYLPDEGDPRYREAWQRYRDGDADRAIAILSTLGERATDADLRVAAHRDEIQILAATYDLDTVRFWIQTSGDLEILAAEYARLGKTTPAIGLLSSFPLGVDERGCELQLNRIQLGDARAAEAAELAIHAGRHGLTRCLDGIAAYLCEESTAWSLDTEACQGVRVGQVADRARLKHALELWRRLTSEESGPAVWAGIASIAVGAAAVPGWERVATDALFNALVAGDCSGLAVTRVRDLAAKAPRPVGGELSRFSILTVTDCRALIATP